MSTHCSTIQFLEPDPTVTLLTDPVNHAPQIEESGVLHLFSGIAVYSVLFAQQKMANYYDFTAAAIVNTLDSLPLALTWVISARDQNGFIVSFNKLPDSANYLWNWTVRVPSLVT